MADVSTSAAAGSRSIPRPSIGPGGRRRVPVPKSSDEWMVVGIWLASRDFPAVPFFLPLVDPLTGKRMNSNVPDRTMMRALSPKYTAREDILPHVRVVQRVDASGLPVGEERYICTDIVISYQMEDKLNAFNWISWQSETRRGAAE